MKFSIECLNEINDSPIPVCMVHRMYLNECLNKHLGKLSPILIKCIKFMLLPSIFCSSEHYSVVIQCRYEFILKKKQHVIIFFIWNDVVPYYSFSSMLLNIYHHGDRLSHELLGKRWYILYHLFSFKILKCFVCLKLYFYNIIKINNLQSVCIYKDISSI